MIVRQHVFFSRHFGRCRHVISPLPPHWRFVTCRYTELTTLEGPCHHVALLCRHAERSKVVERFTWQSSTLQQSSIDCPTSRHTVCRTRLASDLCPDTTFSHASRMCTGQTVWLRDTLCATQGWHWTNYETDCLTLRQSVRKESRQQKSHKIQTQVSHVSRMCMRTTVWLWDSLPELRDRHGSRGTVCLIMRQIVQLWDRLPDCETDCLTSRQRVQFKYVSVRHKLPR